jgi:transposase
MLVFFLYSMRRVQCRNCGAVVVEEGAQALLAGNCRGVPHFLGKGVLHRRVCGRRGLEHRTLGPIRAIAVDEIQYAKGHKYLTLVYQIEQGIIRLLWAGRERTIASFQEIFTLIGKELAAQTEFVLLGYVAALLGRDPQQLLPGAAHPGSLPRRRKIRLRDLLRDNLQAVRAYRLKEDFQQFWDYNSPAWAGKHLDFWCFQTRRSRIEPVKKIARTLCTHRALLLTRTRAVSLTWQTARTGAYPRILLTSRFFHAHSWNMVGGMRDTTLASQSYVVSQPGAVRDAGPGCITTSHQPRRAKLARYGRLLAT